MIRSPASTAASDEFPVQRYTRLRVPATTANMGCGFDCLGMALDLWLEVEVLLSDRWEIVLGGSECGEISLDVSENILVREFVKTVTERLCLKLTSSFRFTIRNEIPLTRGLGSSASAIVGGIAAAYVMAGYDVEDEKVLNHISLEATQAEGHPDNVVPAVHGGLQLSLFSPPSPSLSPPLTAPPLTRMGIPFPVSDLACLVYIPKSRLSTKEARDVLPESYSRRTCASSVSRAALFIAALLNHGPYTPTLKLALNDELHEPYRHNLCPGFTFLKQASLTDEEILGAYLSGAGPSTILLCHPTKINDVLNRLLLKNPALNDQGQFKKIDVIQTPLKIQS